jgi:hypothetical protein
VGLARDGELGAGVVLRVRSGLLLGRESLRFSGTAEESDADLLGSLLSRHYLGGGEVSTADLPKEVLLPGDAPDRELLEEVLGQATERRVRILVPQRGEKRRLVDLAEQNARHVLEDRVTGLAYAADRAEDALYSLQDELDLKVVPRLMVCFDISHTQGSEVVGSAVVFENGEPRKAGYRHMRIQGEWGNDDVRSMNEVVTRYFRRHLDEGTPLPDLAVIDGGKGQLGGALRALRGLETCRLWLWRRRRRRSSFQDDRTRYGWMAVTGRSTFSSGSGTKRTGSPSRTIGSCAASAPYGATWGTSPESGPAAREPCSAASDPFGGCVQPRCRRSRASRASRRSSQAGSSPILDGEPTSMTTAEHRVPEGPT